MHRARNLQKVVFTSGLSLLTLVLFRAATTVTVAAAPPIHTTTAGASDPQQYPIMDSVAAKIVQKYQSSTCEQLWAEKAASKDKPKSAQEQQAISLLRNDAQMRAAFINKIAAPLANKMFECGMIP